jgi:hypothetical protein
MVKLQDPLGDHNENLIEKGLLKRHIDDYHWVWSLDDGEEAAVARRALTETLSYVEQSEEVEGLKTMLLEGEDHFRNGTERARFLEVVQDRFARRIMNVLSKSLCGCG